MPTSLKPHFRKGQPEAGDRPWFAVKKDAQEVFIYDEIGKGVFGGGISAEQFVAEVKAMQLAPDDSLRLRINSPGGNLFDGNTIYNYLKSQPYNVTVHVDGVAASAASIVAMAGDTIAMPENSYMMIHNPWMGVWGDANTLREVADNLDKIREGAVATYMTRVRDTLTEDDVKTMMDEETWLSAKDAVDYGFADEVSEPVQAAALLKFDLEAYGFHTPNFVDQAKHEQQLLHDAHRAWLAKKKSV